MTEENKELKKLTKEILTKQVEESKKAIQYAQNSIVTITEQLQQQRGVLAYAEHLLAQFDLPSVPEEKKLLEVK